MTRKRKLSQAEQYEAALMHAHDHPPAPFNPNCVREPAAEREARTVAMQAFSDTLPADMPEEQKRVLRAKFYREYWGAFVIRKQKPDAR